MTLNQVYRELVELRTSLKKIRELTPSESPGSGSTIPVWSPSLNLDVQVALSSLFDGINPRVIISGERFLFKQLNNLNEDAIEVDDIIQTLLPNGSLFTGRYLGGNDQDYLNTGVYSKISADYGLQEVTDNNAVTDKVITLPGIKTVDGEGFKFFLDNGQTKDISDIEDALGLVYTLDSQEDSKALAAPVGQIILDSLALKIEEETDPTVPIHVKNILESDIQKWFQAYQERIISRAFVGDVNKTLVVTLANGTVQTASFIDEGQGDVDGVINNAEFNTLTGVWTFRTSEGSTITASNDGRYAMLLHAHNVEDITNLTQLLAGKAANFTTDNSLYLEPVTRQLRSNTESLLVSFNWNGAENSTIITWPYAVANIGSIWINKWGPLDYEVGEYAVLSNTQINVNLPDGVLVAGSRIQAQLNRYIIQPQ